MKWWVGLFQVPPYSLLLARGIAATGTRLEIFWRYGFAKRTRISQKIIRISGKKVSRASTPVVFKIAGKSCGRARKIDAEAMNKAKHMRQRWRVRRGEPEMLPRVRLRTSPAPASKRANQSNVLSSPVLRLTVIHPVETR